VEEGGAEKSNTLQELTPRQKEVLVLLGEGENNQEIGRRLNISPNTVARHRENIMQKLNLHSRTDLVKYAIRKGYIEL
jgi:two-component system response regulator NreC